MERRREDLTKLKSYTEEIDNELTMILQTLQWDRKHLLQKPVMVTCKYDSNHKVPPDKTEEHEKECFLKNNGYTKDDHLLPDPLDSESNTLVKLRKEDIEQIIANASRSDVLFKKVYRKIVEGSEPTHTFYIGCHGAEPMSLERLQVSYSADERRAIHDAVVSAVPSCHDLTDLALLSGGDDHNARVILSRMEILVELRNMRRRRTKYRVAAKSRNYSDVLRDVIRTQMEHYNEGKSDTPTKETAIGEKSNQRGTNIDSNYSRQASKEGDRYRRDRKVVPRPIVKIEVKTEREDSAERNRDYNRERSDRTYRYGMGSRDRRDIDSNRRGHDDRSRENRNYENHEKTQKYGEHSRKRRHDNDSDEDYNHRDKTRERRNHYEDTDKERSEKRSRRCHKHRDNGLVYQVKKEPNQDEEPHNYRGESSRERRHDESRDKTYKHKDRTRERYYDDNRRRDRQRSRERRGDNRYNERSSDRIHIKQEREDSVTRDDRSDYEKEKATYGSRKSNDNRYNRSCGDRNYDSYSLDYKQERHDSSSEEKYDPNKKIKEEK